MSTGEIVGSLLAVAVFAASGGAALAAVIAARRDRLAELRMRRHEAYAAWLAARWTLTRASLSFVAAFRTLAAKARRPDLETLRHEEAQRTRSAWSDAMRELDRAQAALITWSDDPSIDRQLMRFATATPEMLREAINGTAQNVAQLAHKLRQEDERAAQFVRRATQTGAGRTGPVRGWIERAEQYAAAIVAHWSRR
jgi:hypothetical protein